MIIETKNTGFLNIFICTTGNSVCTSWYINIGVKTTNNIKLTIINGEKYPRIFI